MDTMRAHSRRFTDFLAAALMVLPVAPAAWAGGVVTTCDESHFDSALGCGVATGSPPTNLCTGGGTVTFNCDGGTRVTIVVTSRKVISVDTSIDGGNLVTLSGDGATQLFVVNSGVGLTIANITIRDGSTNTGGGAIHSNGKLTVRNSTFSGNASTDFVGGAIFNSGATLAVTNSTFAVNRAYAAGGAIATDSQGSVTNCTFYGNSANDGGAIISLGTLSVTNSTFSGNTASRWGGAIVNGNGMLIMMSNSTLAGNSTGADNGGAIKNVAGTVIFTNTIVAASSDGGNCAGIITSDGHNLDSDGTCEIGPATDPLLDPRGLADNGGRTQTLALQANSPAINAGDPVVCAAPPVNGADQRGFIRPGTGATNCSIGAYEYNSPGPACIGDCDDSGVVTVNEIITMVDWALNGAPNPSPCPAVDQWCSNGPPVTITCIIAAVSNALTGCDG